METRNLWTEFYVKKPNWTIETEVERSYPQDKRLDRPQSRYGRSGEEKSPRPCRESNPLTPSP
jgi:hypothetical protein